MNLKTMTLWRIAFMMLAAFSLASCSSDDDEVFFTIGTDGISFLYYRNRRYSYACHLS